MSRIGPCMSPRPGTLMPGAMCGSKITTIRSLGKGDVVHQSSVLTVLLLLILVLKALLRQFRTGVPWELAYANDLMLITDTLKECISTLEARMVGMGCKGLCVNMEINCLDVLKKSYKYPSAVCNRGVSNYSIE